jgi:hypothetical protein
MLPQTMFSSRNLQTVDPVNAMLTVEYILISNGSVDTSSEFGTASIGYPSKLPPVHTTLSIPTVQSQSILYTACSAMNTLLS